MFQPTLDLYNLMDLVAIRSDRRGVAGYQICGEDVAPHIHKIMEGYTIEKIKKNKETKESEIVKTVIPPNPYLKVWLEAENPFFIHGWRLRKHEGTKATYQLRQVEFYLDGADVKFKEVPS